jgi:CMP-N-acetylneuraminic acid synthetase
MSAQKIIAMIPARLGSQRLAKKNLRELNGISLFARAIHKCREADCFDEIWANSESAEIGEIAQKEGANYHQRPEYLADNTATSEQFIAEFLEKHVCDAVVQVHSIAPLLAAAEVRGFVDHYRSTDHDVLLSCILDQIEVAYQRQPVNFSFAKKANSQNLEPVQRITWSITAWRRATFLGAVREGRTATYCGRVGFFTVSAISGHVVKTEQDLKIAEALLPLNGLDPNDQESSRFKCHDVE